MWMYAFSEMELFTLKGRRMWNGICCARKNHLSSAVLKYLGHHTLNPEKILHIVDYNQPNNIEGIYS